MCRRLPLLFGELLLQGKSLLFLRPQRTSLLGNLKKLAGQTALYGLSSILGKTINFLLTPIHTAMLSEAAFGRNVDFYSLIGFLIVLMTYGFETAFFRFSEKPGANKQSVYSTATISLLVSSGVFLLIAFFGQGYWSRILLWEDRPEFVMLLAAILVMDTLSAIPFARLRAQNRALRFVVIKLTLIGVTFLMNLAFFYGLPALIANGMPGHEWLSGFYGGGGEHLIFYANLVGCVVMLVMLLPEFKNIQWVFDKVLWRQMMWFGVPLMVGGFAGIANELLDRQLLKYLPSPGGADPFEQVGIYGAVYKLSIFLVLFNQAFRYAAEPFFFARAGGTGDRQILATVLRYFVVVLCVGLVAVTAGIDLLKYFIDSKFWVGLPILPILLLANVFLGINTHLSIWYKLSDRTSFGIVVTGVGLVFTLAFNLYLIPRMGYVGAAWATLASYAAMTVTSYVLGQKYYRIPYDTWRILLHIVLAVIFSATAYFFLPEGLPLRIAAFVVYSGVVALLEFPNLKPYLKRHGR
jgi:O-antigen/teichoic acid export membrane protein